MDTIIYMFCMFLGVAILSLLPRTASDHILDLLAGFVARRKFLKPFVLRQMKQVEKEEEKEDKQDGNKNSRQGSQGSRFHSTER